MTALRRGLGWESPSTANIARWKARKREQSVTSGDRNYPGLLFLNSTVCVNSTTGSVTRLFSKWHHWYMFNWRGSVGNSHVEISERSRCEKCMLAVANRLLSRETVGLWAYSSSRKKCRLDTRPAGCWAALRWPVSPLSISRVCRGPCPVETRVRSSRLTSSSARAVITWLCVLRGSPIARFWGKCSNQKWALSVVLQFFELRCGPGPQRHERHKPARSR